MKPFNRLLTTACAVALLLYSQQAGLAFQNAAEDGPSLGPADNKLPLLPPPPAPVTPAQPSERHLPAAPPTEPTPHDHAAEAQQLIDEGRYNLAIRAASRAIAADPQNDLYRRIRAEAYQLSGRFEQALADTNPLEVVVAARHANLKSAGDVVASVPEGAVLNVTEVRGGWLKVDSIGDEVFKWAWVSKRDLVQGGPQPVPFVQPSSRTEYYGQRYGGRYYDEGRRSGFGRAYYDWTRHVPPRYWRHLPW